MVVQITNSGEIVFKSETIDLYKPLDVWVLCAPEAWGGHPFAVVFQEDLADFLIETYYDNVAIRASRDTDIMRFGIDPGPAQKFLVPASPIINLIGEAPIDVSRLNSRKTDQVLSVGREGTRSRTSRGKKDTSQE